MAGLVPGIHQLKQTLCFVMDGRVKPGHDELKRQCRSFAGCALG